MFAAVLRSGARLGRAVGGQAAVSASRVARTSLTTEPVVLRPLAVPEDRRNLPVKDGSLADAWTGLLGVRRYLRAAAWVCRRRPNLRICRRLVREGLAALGHDR